MEELRDSRFQNLRTGHFDYRRWHFFHFWFYTSPCVCRRRMRTCQHFSFTIL